MIDYQSVFNRKRQENLQIVKSQIRDGVVVDEELSKKISNHVERWSGIITEEDVINDFMRTRTVPTFLAKDPGKQNLTEQIAKEYLERFPEIETVNILNKSGHNSWCIIEGRLDLRDNFTASQIKGHKTIDFKIKLTNGKYIMAAHKYTKETGGAQDNQRNDLLNFAKNADQYTGNEYLFAAIGDGEYYSENKLRSMFEEAPSVIFCNSDSLVEELRSRGFL